MIAVRVAKKFLQKYRYPSPRQRQVYIDLDLKPAYRNFVEVKGPGVVTILRFPGTMI